MARKKLSFLKIAMIVVIIATLNLMGISYGFWSDSLTGEIKTSTGFVRLSLVDSELEIDDGVSAKLNYDEENDEGNVIEVEGVIARNSEGNAIGEIQLSYIVENIGSLPIAFSNARYYSDQLDEEAVSINVETEEGIIFPGFSSNDTVSIQIDTTAIDTEEAEEEVKASQTDDNDLENSESDSMDEKESETTYSCEIKLHYGIASWTDKITIKLNIRIAKPAAVTSSAPIIKAAPAKSGAITPSAPISQEGIKGDESASDGSAGGDKTEGKSDEPASGDSTPETADDETTGGDEPASRDDAPAGDGDEPASNDTAGRDESDDGDAAPSDSGDKAGGSDAPSEAGEGSDDTSGLQPED